MVEQLKETIMLKYNENMVDVSEQDINYLNASVEEINAHVGYEFISLKGTPQAENECVDIYEDGLETWTSYTFEQAEMYLKGIKKGFELEEKKSN
jgi:hypothetical protein